MVSKGLMRVAENLDLTYVEKLPLESSYVCGVLDGYLVSLYDSGSNKSVFVNYHIREKDEDGDSVLLMELTEQLKETLSNQPVKSYEVKEDGLSYTLACDWTEYVRILEEVLDFLSECEIDGATKCSCCGNSIVGKRPPKKVLKGKDNYLYCDHCALEALENSKKESVIEDATPAKPGLGFLGALVGGLIGIAVYFCLYKWVYPLLSDTGFDFRYIFTAVGLLTAFLVYKGYTIFSKKACVSEALTVSILSIVCTAVGQYAGHFAWYAEKMGFKLFEAMRVPAMWLIHLRSTMDSAVTYDQSVIDMYNISPVFYRLLFISLLFAAIGTVLFQVGLFEKSKPKKKVIEIETYRLPDMKSEGKPEKEPVQTEQKESPLGAADPDRTDSAEEQQ